MPNIISKDGYFYKEIPFTLKNVRKVQNNPKNMFILHDGDITSPHNVRIIATDIKSLAPIIFAVDYDTEIIVQLEEDGNQNILNGSFHIYEKTKFKTYENFKPNIFQSCLIRDAKLKESSWYDEICEGYLNEYLPYFLGRRKDINWEYIPLCKQTLPIRNLTIKWEDYVKNIINNEKK